MANTLWGKVYYQDIFAGFLKQEPGGRCDFTYDSSYLNAKSPAIAFTLPKREESFICETGLHPFFDNLIAEGWLERAQAQALRVNINDRFALLLGFGNDLAGAVSVIDPEPRSHHTIDPGEELMNAAIRGRASLSGVQSKLLLVKEGDQFRPVQKNELSSHIAKFARPEFPDILEVEYLSTLAQKHLLPNDRVVELEMSEICAKPALIIKRFDRRPSGKKIHFEEFNQILGHYSGNDKYSGSYEDMGTFMCKNPYCLPAEADTLYRRILASLLLGNTDAHFKNFALLHTKDGFRLTESYDLVAACYYPPFQTIALGIAQAYELRWGDLKSKHIVEMGYPFGLNDVAIKTAAADLKNSLEAAIDAVLAAHVGSKKLKQRLINLMEKRWKGSFESIGVLLSKRQSTDGKRPILRKKR